MQLRLIGIAVIGAALGACAGEGGVRCEDAEQYQSARTAPPLRIPDDLSIPDESEAITIPPPPSDALEQTRPPGSCLESPPDFFEGELG